MQKCNPDDALDSPDSPNNAECSTPERILQAALEEFAEYGFAGARVERIARRARCNKQLLYHHFGNKEELCRRVLTQAMVQQSKELPDVFKEGPIGLVQRGLEHVVREEKACPLRMILWESLDFEEPLALEERKAHFAEITNQCTFVEDEELRPYVMLALLSTVLFPQVACHFPKLLTGESGSSETFRTNYLRALKLILTPSVAKPTPV